MKLIFKGIDGKWKVSTWVLLTLNVAVLLFLLTLIITGIR